LKEEKRNLKKELRFQEDLLAGRKEKLAELKAGRWRVDGESLEEFFERRLKELFMHAERGHGVHASGGVDKPFVDLSRPAYQW
jgi:hypothetical protein